MLYGCVIVSKKGWLTQNWGKAMLHQWTKPRHLQNSGDVACEKKCCKPMESQKHVATKILWNPRENQMFLLVSHWNPLWWFNAHRVFPIEDSLERQCLERALPLTLWKYDETPRETGILEENQGGNMGQCRFHRERYRPMVIRKLQHLHFLRFCSHKTWVSHVKGHAKVARRPPSNISNVSTVCDHKQNAYQHGTGTCIQQNKTPIEHFDVPFLNSEFTICYRFIYNIRFIVCDLSRNFYFFIYFSGGWTLL